MNFEKTENQYYKNMDFETWLNGNKKLIIFVITLFEI